MFFKIGNNLAQLTKMYFNLFCNLDLEIYHSVLKLLESTLVFLILVYLIHSYSTYLLKADVSLTFRL